MRHDKTKCNYCGGVTVDDMRGNCGACGAPRNRSNDIMELATRYKEAQTQTILSIFDMKLTSGGWTDEELNAYLEIGKVMR